MNKRRRRIFLFSISAVLVWLAWKLVFQHPSDRWTDVIGPAIALLVAFRIVEVAFTTRTERRWMIIPYQISTNVRWSPFMILGLGLFLLHTRREHGASAIEITIISLMTGLLTIGMLGVVYRFRKSIREVGRGRRDILDLLSEIAAFFRIGKRGK